MCILMNELLYPKIKYLQTDAAVDSSNASVYTFSAMSIGSAWSNRQIIVHAAAQGDKSVSSITIAGVSASVVSDGTTSAESVGESSVLYSAVVPTGTTGDVVVTYSGSNNNCGITVYNMLHAKTSAFHVQKDSASSGTETSVSLNVHGLGANISGQYTDGNGGTRTHSWSGLTEDVDATLESDKSYSSASNQLATEEAGRSITVTVSGAIDFIRLVAASFAPL